MRLALIFVVLLLVPACGGGGSGGGGGNAAAVAIGGLSDDQAEAVATLSDGSTIVVGTFRETVVFGAGSPNETTLVAAGLRDTFIARYDASMRFVWVRHAAGPQNDEGRDVAVGADDGIYVVGTFRQSVSFVGGQNPAFLFSMGSSDTDSFLVRYLPDGTLDWLQHVSGSGGQTAQGVAVAADGTAYITGEFYVGATFGKNQPGETTFPSFGGEDMFLARYDANGFLLWATLAGGTSSEYGQAIVAHPQGGCVITGSFADSAVFGLFETNSTTLTSADADDMFLARYGTDGKVVWAKRAGGLDGQSGEGIACMPDGSIVVTGRMQNSMIFGPGEASTVALPIYSTADLYVARYAADGSVQWANQVGGLPTAAGFDLDVRPDASIVVAGSFKGTATVDPGKVTQTTLSTSDPLNDALLICYTPAGTMQWVHQAGGIDADSAYGVACHTNGATVLVGGFQGAAAFGIGDPNETILQTNGATDAFIARFGPAGTLE